MSNCGCGCTNGSGDYTAMAGAGFVRPRFFGGMLLTEDDLQAVVDYSLAKHKLTNRYVIGAGVVCGLDVKEDPCNPRAVVVSPGYAIECCGNDILVSCPETLDIIDLVRDLRQRTGVDCGEPCDEQPPRDYYLYVRYVETQTSPVAPYTPDDCATGDCEFSRVSEGYSFELRCDGPEDLDNLIDALCECRPSEEEVRRRVADTQEVVSLVQRDRAIAEEVAKYREAVVRAPSAAAFKKVLVDPDKPEGAVRFDEGVELVGRVVAARAQAVAEERPEGARPVPQSVLGKAKSLAERLRASEELNARPPEERARIGRVLTTAIEQPDLSTLTHSDRAWLREGSSPADADRTFVVRAREVQDGVLRQLADQGDTGSEDYRAVSAMSFRSLSGASISDVSRLAAVFLRLARGCACSAFNPPCPTCTDDAVALARVSVDGCEVVDVCTLVRHWVMAPRTLGYWFPVAEALRDRLERVCCAGENRRVAAAEEGRVSATPYAIAEHAGADLAQRFKLCSGDERSEAKIAALERKVEALRQHLAAAEEKGVPA